MAIDLEDVFNKKCRNCCRYLFVLVILLPYRQALYMEGEIQSKQNWIFLARFCFLSEIGRVEFEVEYPKSYETQNLVLYYDEHDQWPAVYPPETAKKKTCKEKESVVNPENNQVINLTTRYKWAGCVVTRPEDNDIGIETEAVEQDTYICRAGRSFKSARERWWYMVLDNCDTEVGLYLKYKLTFTNGNGWWEKHFSADQFGILQTDIVFICMYGLLFSLSVYVAIVLSNRQLFHTTYKMYMVVLILYLFSLLLYVIYYADFAGDGTPLVNCKMTAQVVQAMADGMFLLMLILMAKGYTITRGRISHSGSVKIAVLMCLYAMLYVALFIYQSVVFDPGEVLYRYESPAGFGLIAIRGVCWLWFIYAIFFTLKHYPEKGVFYYPFFFLYTLWFIATPIMTLIATFVMPKWWREKIINFIELLIAYTAQFVFLVLTRPSAANLNFPYHVRTSQIGILETPNGNQSQNIDGFTHHGYGQNTLEGNSLGHSPNFTELFTVNGGANNERNQRNSNGTTATFTATAYPPNFSRSNGANPGMWPSLPPLPMGHLPPIQRDATPQGGEPPPYPTSSNNDRDVSALFTADSELRKHSPREMGGLFALESDGTGSNASDNPLVQTRTSSFIDTNT